MNEYSGVDLFPVKKRYQTGVVLNITEKMKRNRILLAIIIGGICCSLHLTAQEKATFNPLTDEISEYIPPLSVLLDSALSNDPKIDFRILQIEVNERKFKSVRRQWTRNFGVQADFRYGTFDNLSVNDAGSTNPTNLYNTREEFKFGYAAYVKFPIIDFIDRNNQLQLAKAEIYQAESMTHLERNEKRQMVLLQYNELILAQRLLRIKIKSLETARINMLMAEKEFLNGIIPVSEYSRLSESVSGTEIDYETTRMSFLTNYQILEEMVGYKFNVLMKYK